MTESPVRAGVVAAEVEAVTGSAVVAAAEAGLRLAWLFGVDEDEASLAVASALDVALGARRPWSAVDTAQFAAIFPSTLRHFLADARGPDDDAGGPDRGGLVGRLPSRAPTYLCDDGAAPRAVNEAISAFEAAGGFGARVLSDRPNVVVLVAALGRCLGLVQSDGTSSSNEAFSDRASVDLCLMRVGLRWRRGGEPPPVPLPPAALWRPGTDEASFAWACARRVARRPCGEAVAVAAALGAAAAELVGSGVPPPEVERHARALAAQLP